MRQFDGHIVEVVVQCKPCDVHLRDLQSFYRYHDERMLFLVKAITHDERWWVQRVVHLVTSPLPHHDSSKTGASKAACRQLQHISSPHHGKQYSPGRAWEDCNELQKAAGARTLYVDHLCYM